MNARVGRRFRRFIAGVATAGCVGVLLAGLGAGRFFDATRNAVFDAYQRLAPAQRSTARIVIVDIDDESIRRIGQWPWPRDQVARLVSGLAGAKVVGIDILLSEPDRLAPAVWVMSRPELSSETRAALLALPDTDAALAAALERVPTVLAAAAAPSVRGAAGPSFETATPIFWADDSAWPSLPQASDIAMPLARFGRVSRGIGLVTAQRDADGVVRRLPAFSGVGSTLLPGFAAEVVRVGGSVGRIVLRAGWTGTSVLRIGDREVRADALGRIRPRYTAPEHFRTVAAWTVLSGTADPEWFRDKVVLIGVSALGIGETFLTPLGRSLPAIGVQAQLVDSLHAGDTLVRPPLAPAAELLLALCLGVGSILMFGRIREPVFWLMQAGAGALLAGGGFLLFCTDGLLLDWTFPVAVLAAADAGLLVGRVATTRRRRREEEAELRTALERAQAAEREGQLRETAKRAGESLEIALDAAQMGIWDCDLRTGGSERSRRHDEIFGCAPSVPWGRDAILSRVAPEDRETVKRAFEQAAQTGALHVNCRIVRPDHTRAAIVIDGRISHDADGVPLRMAGVVADITEQRRLEERLHQSEKLRSIGMIAGGVAHNFNNMLTVIIGNLDLAGREVSLSDPARPLLDAAKRAAAAGASLTWQLLSYARQQRLRPEVLQTGVVLREFANLLISSLSDDITIEIDLPEGLWPLHVDRTELELALLNLGINARDAMKGGGRIRLAAANRQLHDEDLGLSGEFVVIAMSDTGTGISPDILPRVFEPFITTKPIGEGTGLAACRS